MFKTKAIGLWMVVAVAAAVAVLLFGAHGVSAVRQGFGGTKQEWGFEEVREGAHMFWWLYFTTANVSSYTERPLVIWLQGGPGASSTGYGNFEELGQLDLNLNERNFTWVRDMNVLFIDNPVGSGFSYVDNKKYLTTNNTQIAMDLVEMMRRFYEQMPEFKGTPLHIFSESYGGKMAAEFALLLNGEIKAKRIESNLKSVAMGDSWISPMDSMLAWAPFLLNMGLVDHDGYAAVHNATMHTQAAVDDNDWVEATKRWGTTEVVIMRTTHGVDFYNVLLPTMLQRTRQRIAELEKDTEVGMYKTLVAIDDRDQILDELMNGPVKESLKIPANVVWGGQSGQTFSTLAGDFMKPVISVVETLLNETTLNVIVFTGHLDLIVATPGTVNWVDRLNWRGAIGYKNAPRNGMAVKDVLEGYYKKYGKFSMYWVNRAGHMVPSDNPNGMDYILRDVTKYDNKF